MRSVFRTVWRVLPLAAVLVVFSSGVEGQTLPTDPAEHHIRPPVGASAASRLPPVGVAPNHRIQPPIGVAPQHHIRPPVGEPVETNVWNAFLLWLQVRLGPSIP
jgi:hypothetical protein